MTILIIAIIVFILFIIPMIYLRLKKDDLFSPMMIASFFLIVTNVPYLFSIANNYEIINPLVLRHIPSVELNIAIAYYALVLIIGAIGLFLGIKSKLSFIIIKPIPVLLGNESNKRYFTAFFFALSIGLLAYIYFISSVGGFSYWIDNLSSRASSTSGNGYILSLISLLNLAVFLFICSFKYKKSYLKYLILLILIIGVAFIHSSFGGRKPTLQFIVFSLLVWHYGVERIKRIPLKSLLIVPIALIYITVIPILRSAEGVDYYFSNPDIMATEVSDNLGGISSTVSYIDHYLFILDYFSLDKIWLGRSFIDLIYAPIPSSLYPDKPPIDDGVYVRTLAEGQEVIPSTPFRNMFPSSWPPETIGNMYMNFWIPGVFLGMYLLGVFYKVAYFYMKKSNYSLISILIYGNILLNLHISNLRIVQTLSDILLMILFLSIFFFGFKSRSR